MIRNRTTAWAWMLVLALGGTGLAARAQTQTPTSPAWVPEVRAMLARRAAAVEKGDEKAFLASVAGASQSFVQKQRDWFTRFRSLPIGVYRLDFTQDEYGELTRASDRDHHGGE